jgi:hypothetical protein
MHDGELLALTKSDIYLLSIRHSGIPGVQEFRSSGVQEFRSSGVQEFRSSGVQEFRSSGWRRSENYKQQNGRGREP